MGKKAPKTTNIYIETSYSLFYIANYPHKNINIHHIYLWKRHFPQYLKMHIIRYHALRVCCYCTIHKLVVISVRCNEVIAISGCYLYHVG